MLSIRQLCTQQRTLSLISRYSNRFVSVSASSNGLNRIDELIVKLDLDVRRTGRVNSRDVRLAIKEITKSDFQKSSQGLLLLKCCGSLLPEEPVAARSELLRDIWSTIKAKSEGSLDISYYNALLNVYIENNESFNPAEILAEIESKSIQPNRVTFQRLIHRYCQLGDIEGATKILEFMKSKSLPLNETIFNSLILGYSRAGDLDSALGVVKQMSASEIDPTNETYRILLCSVVEHIKIKSEEEIKEKFNSIIKEIENNELILTSKDLLDVIKSIAGVDEKSSLVDYVLSLCPQEIGYNQDCFNTILELININAIQTAMKVFYTMKISNNLRETKTAGMFVIEQMVKIGAKQDEVFKICDELKAKELNNFGHSKATEAALRYCDLTVAKDYLDKFLSSGEIKPRVHFYWPLLKKCTSSEQLFQMISDNMANFSFTSSYSELYDTFVDYVWEKFAENEIDIYVEKFKDIGFSQFVVSSSYMGFLLKHQKLANAVKYISQEKNSGLRVTSPQLCRQVADCYMKTDDVVNTVKLMASIVKNGNNEKNSLIYTVRVLYDILNQGGESLEKFMTLVQALADAKMNIPLRDVEVISKRINANEKDHQLLLSIGVTVEDVDVNGEQEQVIERQSAEDLERQLSQLHSKGIVARGTVRQLINAYCRQFPDTTTEEGKEILARNRKRLEEIIADSAKTNTELTNASRALLVDFYAFQCEDLDAAMKMKSQIPAEFGIDDFKIVHLATLMVKKGLIKESFELIKNECDRTRPRPVDVSESARRRTLERDVFRLVDQVAEQTKDYEMVKNMLDSLLDLTKMKPTNVLLGPLIKVHLLNDKFENAVEQYLECTKMYGLGPWKGELMKLAIIKDDSNALQKITDESVTIYGEPSTLVDLCISFLRAGKPKQAKKVISTPGLRVNQLKINRIFDRLVTNSEVSVIEQFITISRDLFDLNRDDLYYRLLRAYSMTNNIEKGSEVWTLMQEENLTASERTLRFLAEFLEENGKKVPFAVHN